MRKILYLVVVLPLLLQVRAQAEDEPKVYRWVDEAGTVHFSTTPPAGVKTTEIELRQPGAVIRHEDRTRLLEQGRLAGDQADLRIQEREALLQRREAAQAELRQARQALTEGEAPQPGERQRLAGGGSRLTEAYHQRRAAEAQRVAELEAQVAQLNAEIDQLR